MGRELSKNATTAKRKSNIVASVSKISIVELYYMIYTFSMLYETTIYAKILYNFGNIGKKVHTKTCSIYYWYKWKYLKNIM